MSELEGKNGYYLQKTGARVKELLERHFIVPTFTTPPTENTLSWNDDGNIVNFRIGEAVRVVTSNGCDFYRVDDIKDNKVIWRKLENLDKSNFYTKEEINNKGFLTNTAASNFLTEEDLLIYYTKEEIDDLFSNIEIPEQGGSLDEESLQKYLDVHKYIKEDYLTKYYTKTEINKLIEGVIAGGIDLTNYYTKTEIDASLIPINTWYKSLKDFIEVKDNKLYIKSDFIVEGDALSNGQFAARTVGENTGGGATYLADLYDVSLGSLLSGDILSWNGNSWVNIKQSSLVPDLSAYASKSFVSDALEGYLPLSGGTMQGRLTISPKNYLGLVVDSPDVSLNQINLKALGELKGIFQYNSTYGVGFHYQDKGGIYVDEQEYPRFVDASLNVHTLLHSGNIGSQSVAYASNAGLLQGHSLISGTNVYGCIPTVGSDGVMEVGKYLDFHNDSNADSDYDLRLMIEGKYGNTVVLPHSNGTLALTTDNVASATKLATPRTIWGQSFDGTGDVSGNLIYNGETFITNGTTFTSFGNTSRISYIDGSVIHFNSSGHGMAFSTSGNLLIGTTSDSGYKLDVFGTVRFGGILTTSEDTIIDTTKYSGGYWARGIVWKQNDTELGNLCYTSVSDRRISIVHGAYYSALGVHILSNGNTLIGTTYDRGHRLTVGRPDGAANLTSTTLNNSLLFVGMSEGADSYGTNFWTEDSGNGFIQQGRTDEEQPSLYNLILQPFGGNVLIGTTDDNGKKLQVNGNISAYAIEANSISNYDSGTGYFVGKRNTGLGVTDGGLLLYTYGNTPMSFYTNAASRMQITGDGNVLIGTTSDNGAKLQVEGNITAKNSLSLYESDNIYFHLSQTPWYATIQSTHIGTAYLPIAINGNGGNVGIGTYNPQATLDVVGSARVNEITIGGIRIYVENGVLKINGDVYSSGQFGAATAAN